MIRCVRIWTGQDRNSHFEEGHIRLNPGARGDILIGALAATSVSFEETSPGGAFAWHDAPHRQLVITLSGSLDFETAGANIFSCVQAMSCSLRTPPAAVTDGG